MQQDITFPEVEEQFETTIGLVAQRRPLVCTIHLGMKTTNYNKTRKQVLQVALGFEERVKRWAFGRIHVKGRADRYELSEFLPGELLRGNARVIPEYLRRLKTQRVEAYIPLRWNQKQPGSRTMWKLVSFLCQLAQRRKMLALKKITERGRARSFKRTNNEDTRSYMIDTSGRSLSAVSAATPGRKVARSLNVTVVRVSMIPEKGKRSDNRFCRETERGRRPQSISIKEL